MQLATSIFDAKAVLAGFINPAENSARIFTHSLNHEIYNGLELMYAIKKALDRKAHFDIGEKSFCLAPLLDCFF